MVYKFRASRKRCTDDPDVIRHVFKATEKKDFVLGNLGETYLTCGLCGKPICIGDITVQYYDDGNVPENHWDTTAVNITVCLDCDLKELQ